MTPLERDGSLHRMFLEGGGELFMSGLELAATQKIVYYCHECAAYHLRPEFTVQEFVTALNAPFLDQEKGENV